MKKTSLVIGCVLAAFLLNIALFGSLLASGTSIQDQEAEVEMGDYIYSSFFGGTNEDISWSVVVDSQANIIVAGSTYSTNCPVLNAYQDTYGGGDKPGGDMPYHIFGGDGFVAKFDPAGQLTWSTFLGGINLDCARYVTVDTSDNIIVIGTTNSTDYPVTDDAYQSSYSGGVYDLFITKFAPNGTLTYSSYFGGSGQDLPNDLVLDLSDNLIITGRTESVDFPLTVDAADSEIGGDSDAILVKFAPDCKTLLYSTYFGGSGTDSGVSIAIDNQSNIILSGSTSSPDLPITGDAYQDTIKGFGVERDFFVAKFSAEDYQLSYATYFGGSQAEDCYGLAVDSSGNIILTGRTWSGDFPTENAYQEEYTGLNNPPTTDHGELDGFITKLSADGQNLVFSTYLGEVSWDTVFNPVIDKDDNIIVTFLTDFRDFPVIDGLLLNANAGSGNFLVIKMSPTGDFLFSSYLGGSFYDHPHDQFIADGTIYIAGQTESYNFLATDDAYQQQYMGGIDGFIFRLELSDYLDDLGIVVDTTGSSTATNGVPGFELHFVLLALTSSISLLTRARKRKRQGKCS
ncbi:MAG: SBBP repeat-containing protein [Candidatus Odinarchaeota archaeon]